VIFMSRDIQTKLQILFETSQKRVAQNLRDQIGAKVEIIKGIPTSENYSYVPKVEIGAEAYKK
jgi:hypothetical protein